MNTEFNYLKSAALFTIVGFLIPGFTAILLILILLFATSLGLKCTLVWNTLWILMLLGSLITPFIFFKYHLKKTEDTTTKRNKFRLFNIIEYTLLQGSITNFITSADTLCNVKDGQNGIQLILAAWLAFQSLF